MEARHSIVPSSNWIIQSSAYDSCVWWWWKRGGGGGRLV